MPRVTLQEQELATVHIAGACGIVISGSVVCVRIYQYNVLKSDSLVYEDISYETVFSFLNITSQAHRHMNTSTSRGSCKAENAREGGKRR